MATSAPKPCRRSGCSALVYGGNGFCEKHQSSAEPAWVKAPDQSGRGGRPWRRLRLLVLKRDGWLCQCEDCKQRSVPLIAHEVDHIDNTRINGRLNNCPENLQAINRDCHRKKSQKEASRCRFFA